MFGHAGSFISMIYIEHTNDYVEFTNEYTHSVKRGEERFREEGETAQKNSGRRDKGRKKIGRRENQHEKGEGRLCLKKRDLSL